MNADQISEIRKHQEEDDYNLTKMTCGRSQSQQDRAALLAHVDAVESAFISQTATLAKVMEALTWAEAYVRAVKKDHEGDFGIHIGLPLIQQALSSPDAAATAMLEELEGLRGRPIGHKEASKVGTAAGKALKEATDAFDAAQEQLCTERDAAEEALSQAYYLITGKSPEWSNLFGHVQALEEIDDAQKALRSSLSQSRARELPEGCVAVCEQCGVPLRYENGDKGSEGGCANPQDPVTGALVTCPLRTQEPSRP